MSAASLARYAVNQGARQATALDIALTDYWRRHGDVRFTVTGVRVTDDGGVEFTVEEHR